MKKSTEVANVMTESQLAILRESYPVESSFNRILLPRFGLVSQDITEEVKNAKGKKEIKILSEAGTFFIEKQTEELNEEGKKIWERKEIGTTAQGIILFQRKQLRFYDSANETYTSSPVYDNDEQIIPLFANKVEVDRGTPKELKSRKIYQGVSAKGKPVSKLEDNRILYVLHKDEVYQVNLRGTSMYAFMTYARKNLPPSVITKFGSEAKVNGTIAWSQMTFDAVRPITQEEGKMVQEKMNEIRKGVEAEKSFYASKTPEADKKADEEFEKIGNDVEF